MKACITEFVFFYICAKIFAVQKKFQWAMPLHLERGSHQNCKQDPVGLKNVHLFSFRVSKGHLAHFSLNPHAPFSHYTTLATNSPLSPQAPHFHRNSPLSHHLLPPHHTLPAYSHFSPHNTLPTLLPHTLHSLTTHSLLSHHTILTLSPHQSLGTHSRLSLQTPTFSFLPHHTLFYRRTTHLQLSHQNTLSPLTPTVISHHTLPTLSTHHTL